jgi:hypothetical protein
MLDRSSVYMAIRHFVGALALTGVLCFICVVMLPT